VCSSEVGSTSILHFGVMGDKLKIKGVQDVELHLNDRNYSYKFCLFSSNGRDGITGIDFFSEMNAKLDLETEELSLLKFPNYNLRSLDWMAREAGGTVDQSAVIIFSTLDGRDSKAERAHKFGRFEGTQKEMCIHYPKKSAYKKRSRGLLKPRTSL